MEAAQIDSGNRIGLYFAARINFDDGKFSEAAGLAERAIQAHPQDTNIRNLLGMSYLGDDRFQEAIQQFEVVIADRPNDAIAIYNLGQAYLALEDWGRAVEQFQKAQNMFESGSATQGALLYDLGIAFERLSRNEDALRAFQDSAAIRETTNVQDAIDRVQERIRRGKGGGSSGGATPSAALLLLGDPYDRLRRRALHPASPRSLLRGTAASLRSPPGGSPRHRFARR